MTKKTEDDKLYHIYAKDKCLYHSLNEDEFKLVWESLNNITAVYSEIEQSDLQYEIVIPPTENVITYPC